jgi:hypothetical protein
MYKLLEQKSRDYSVGLYGALSENIWLDWVVGLNFFVKKNQLIAEISTGWFYEGWDIFNKRFMKSLGKVFPELLLERIYYHRIKLENFDVIQRALESQEDQELDAEQVIKNTQP